MNLTDTTKILKRLLAQIEHSIEQNRKELEDAKSECIKDSNTKMWIEANEERMIRYNEEVDALRQALRYTRRQREYEDWTNKNF
jgi:hypothetical protein